MSSVPASPPDRIAYGLRIGGLPAGAPLLQHPPGPRWPGLEIAHESPEHRSDPVDPADTTVPLRGGGRLRLRGPTATFIAADPPTDDALVHPHLAAAAAGRNRLLGREVLHAGAAVVDDSAWAIAGPNEAGKSTMLAAFGGLGLPVLSDDLLVVERTTAFAGPRCADLRAPTPVAGLSPPRAVRDGQRWRVLLPPAPPSAPLAGFLFLSWHDGPVILQPLSAAERMRRLAPLRRWRFLPDRPAGLLDLATLPAFEIARPRSQEPVAAARAVLRALPRHGSSTEP